MTAAVVIIELLHIHQQGIKKHFTQNHWIETVTRFSGSNLGIWVAKGEGTVIVGHHDPSLRCCHCHQGSNHLQIHSDFQRDFHYCQPQTEIQEPE